MPFSSFPVLQRCSSALSLSLFLSRCCSRTNLTQVRKDLSKTLETLKTVVRRAPKRPVKVESAPLPAPKPRSYPPPIKTGEQSLLPGRQASSLDDRTNGAVSATETSAPVTGSQEETTAPFSSVLRGDRDKHANGEGNVFSYQARTIVEELPEEAEGSSSPPAPSTTPAAPTNPAAASGRASPSTSDSAAPREDRAAETAPGSSGVDGEAAAGLSTKAADTGVARPAASEAAPAGDDARRSPEAAAVAVAAAGGEAGPGRPAVSPAAAESEEADADAKQAGSAGGAAGGGGGDSIGDAPRDSLGETAAPSAPPPLKDNGTTEAKDKAAPPPPSPPPLPTARPSSAADSTTRCPPGSTATPQALQLPTTGYQFELMWRSAEGSPEARLELLRAVPPSSVAKFFRRTPIEVDLLGGVLRDLGGAFLPRKPATALRWLKSLSKACRFGMTVALLGEADGRAAAREVLTRLEAAPPAKVDPRDVDVLRKQFLV